MLRKVIYLAVLFTSSAVAIVNNDSEQTTKEDIVFTPISGQQDSVGLSNSPRLTIKAELAVPVIKQETEGSSSVQIKVPFQVTLNITDTFFTIWERIRSAPEAIKWLRRQILDLAKSRMARDTSSGHHGIDILLMLIGEIMSFYGLDGPNCVKLSICYVNSVVKQILLIVDYLFVGSELTSYNKSSYISKYDCTSYENNCWS